MSLKWSPGDVPRVETKVEATGTTDFPDLRSDTSSQSRSHTRRNCDPKAGCNLCGAAGDTSGTLRPSLPRLERLCSSRPLEDCFPPRVGRRRPVAVFSLDAF